MSVEVGQVVAGSVRNHMPPVGAFVEIDDGPVALLHIHDAGWGSNVTLPEVGERVAAQVLAVEDGRVSIGVKQLTEDPTARLVDRHHPGDELWATVTLINSVVAVCRLPDSAEVVVHLQGQGPTRGLCVGDSVRLLLVEMTEAADGRSASARAEIIARPAPAAHP